MLDLIHACRDRALSALEFAAGVPGGLGGAVAGNAGCYGKAIGEFVLAAELCGPDGSGRRTVPAGFFEFGYRALANVFATTLGATILVLARKDARVLLGQAPTAYRGIVSYGVRKLRWLGPTQAHFTFERDFLVPSYHCGVFTAALDAVGVRNPRVTGTQVSLLEATYEVGWDG